MFRHSIYIFFLAILITGCSQTSNPVTPDSDSHNDYLSPIIDLTLSNGDEMPAIGLMGAWELHINPDDMSADLIAKRSSAIGEAWIISGISYFTMSPCATCLKIAGLELLPNGIVSAKFNIRHPFEPGDEFKPPSATNRLDLDVFDVALIVYPRDISPETFSLTGRSIYSNICDSPDGYTTELSSFIGDQAALPYFLVIDNSITSTSTFNKFEMGASVNFDAKFNLSAGAVMFDLYLTMGYGASAIRAERLRPKYYNPEFNRNAAWKVEVIPPSPAQIGYTWDDDNSETTYDVVVHVYDWQQGATVYDNPVDFHNAPKDNIYASSNVASVSVEIPGMTSTLPIETNATSGSGTPDDPLIYNFPIANENLVAAGEYTGLVKVLDERATSNDFIIENRDYLIHTPDGVTLNEYLMTEYATYQTFTATVVESEITGGGNLLWAKQAGGNSSDTGAAITVLSDDSIVITGDYTGAATFGRDEPGQVILYSDAGSSDIFVARYDSDGMLMWAKSAGGIEQDWGYGITALSDDSVVVTGFIRDTATFGQGEPNETQLISTGLAEIFIARYDSEGNLLWAKQAGSTDQDWGRAVTALGDDSVVVTGQFRGTATFDPGGPNQIQLVSAGDQDIFVARYDKDGNLIWAKRAGGGRFDGGYAVTACSDNSSVVAGFFSSNATFGPEEANETILSTGGGVDMFVAKYNPDGTLQWAKRAGGLRDALAHAVTTLSDDTVVVSGYYEGTVTFGEGEPNETSFEPFGNSRVLYFARYDTDGMLQWAKRAGGTNTDTTYGLTTLSDDSFIATGHVRSSESVFGEGEPNETIVYLEEGAMDDVYVARFRSDGSFMWVTTAGSTSPTPPLPNARDFGRGAAALSDNSSVIVGTFMYEAVFGKDEPNETTLVAPGIGSDIFIARFEP